jgi:hypothetical protein
VTLTLYTNRYQAFRPAMGVPVKITLGHPRFRLPYVLEHRVPELAPARSYFNAPEAEFERRYYEQLAKHGVPLLAEKLQAVADKAGEDRLVLLCFEDLTKFDDPVLACHRRMFAMWWEQQTGDPVRELGPTRAPVVSDPMPPCELDLDLQ